MRTLLAAAIAFAALGFSAANAGQVSVQPIVLSADAREKFEDTYGIKEVDYLQSYLDQRLAYELGQAGATIGEGAPLTLKITLNDAKPNRPTFKQLGDKPGLDFGRSIAIGGADFTAQFVDANGDLVREVGYRWYETNIVDAVGSATWTDARRAIRRFAQEVGEAYADAETPPAG